MITEAQNKSMDSSAVDNKEVQPTTVKAVSVLENEYFYPESSGYQAITVRAATKIDADAIYLTRRKPVIAPVAEEKVATSETNNE